MLKKQRNAPWLKLLFKLWTQLWIAKAQNRLALFVAAAKTGDIVRTLGFRSTYIINDPIAIAHILVQNESNYTKIDTSADRVACFLGRGLITNSGEAWQCTRQEVQRHFYYKHLTQFIPTITNTTEKLFDHWATRQGETVDIVFELSKLVLEITGMTLFGANIHQDAGVTVQIIRAANQHTVNGFFIDHSLPTPKNRQYRRGRNYIDELIQKILNPPHLNSDLIEPALQCLRNQPNDSSTDQLRHLDEAKTFLIAGYETTAAGLCWALHLLSKNPTILAELREEIDTVLNGNVPTLELLEKLELTSMVIEETLRLHPPIWVIDRTAIADDSVIGYRIPAKSLILIVPYTLHRHPQYWTDPEQFNPQRFNKMNPHAHPKNAYIPFGLGPRVCMGKQLALLMMKTILPMILQRFELTIDPNLAILNEPLVILKPDVAIPFKFQQRTVRRGN